MPPRPKSGERERRVIPKSAFPFSPLSPTPNSKLIEIPVVGNAIDCNYEHAMQGLARCASGQIGEIGGSHGRHFSALRRRDSACHDKLN